MSKNEVTELGIDYDGAISSGEDGWQCEDCWTWNQSHHEHCRSCYDYQNEWEVYDDSEETSIQCFDCDGHDACYDFGCAIQNGQEHLLDHRNPRI